jgi:hypothetical protein
LEAEQAEENGSPREVEVLACVRCLQIAIDGERQALAMQFQDHTRAIAHVQQLGFILQREDGTIDVAAEYIVD